MSHGCPHTLEVLARHLDGDVFLGDGPGTLTADGLADHLRGCPRCQRELALSRELDAALAAGAGTTGDRMAGERVLAGALERITAAEAPPPEPRRPRARRPWLTGAGLVAVGFALAWLLRARPVPPEVPPPQAAPSPGRVADRAPPPGIRIPPDGGLPRTRRSSGPIVPDSRAALDALVQRVLDPGAGRVHRALELLRRASWTAVGLPAPGGVPPPAAARAAVQERAGGLVLASRHRDAPASWFRLWRAAGTRARNGMLPEARRERRLVRWLHHRLAVDDTPELLILAATLGIPDLDEHVQRAGARDPERIPAIAGAVAAVERPDRTAFLLGLWARLAARHGAGDGTATARTLFAPQPPETTVGLVAVLRASHHAVERQRALLALAVRADPAASDALIALLTGPRRPEAELAAWALSRLTAADVEPLRPLARRTGTAGALARAAMAGAGCREVVDWVGHLELTPEERAILEAGRFTRDQFPIAVKLFRERPLAGH